jgi:hypothetical protein
LTGLRSMLRLRSKPHCFSTTAQKISGRKSVMQNLPLNKDLRLMALIITNLFRKKVLDTNSHLKNLRSSPISWKSIWNDNKISWEIHPPAQLRRRWHSAV